MLIHIPQQVALLNYSSRDFCDSYIVEPNIFFTLNERFLLVFACIIIMKLLPKNCRTYCLFLFTESFRAVAHASGLSWFPQNRVREATKEETFTFHQCWLKRALFPLLQRITPLQNKTLRKWLAWLPKTNKTDKRITSILNIF